MKRLFILLILICCLPDIVNAQIIDVKSRRMSEAQEMKDEGDYFGAIKKLESLKKKFKNDYDIQDLLDECVWAAQEQETSDFQQAYDSRSESQLINYIDTYNNKYTMDSAHYVLANTMLEEVKLWNQCKYENSIEAYKHYLSSSSVHAFDNNANEKIQSIQSDQAWTECENSDDKALLQRFIQNYPKSSHVSAAKQRIDLIDYNENIRLGKNYFVQENYEQAQKYLQAANDYQPLSESEQELLRFSNENLLYKQIVASNDISAVKNYMDTHEGNSYFDEVSNHYALLRAKELTLFSTESDFTQVRSFAKDPSTLDVVNNYINTAKAERAKYDHQQKVEAHKAWWKGNFKIGIEGDIETNVVATENKYSSSKNKSGGDIFYSAGLNVRFGSEKHVFSFTTGIKYRWLSVNPEIANSSSNDNEWETLARAVCVPLNLRFGIGKISLHEGKQCRFFIGCGCEYAFSVKPTDEGEGVTEDKYVSLYPSMGFIGKNVEFSLYWKTYLNKPFCDSFSEDVLYKCNSMFGMQLGIYF